MKKFVVRNIYRYHQSIYRYGNRFPFFPSVLRKNNHYLQFSSFSSASSSPFANVVINQTKGSNSTSPVNIGNDINQSPPTQTKDDITLQKEKTELFPLRRAVAYHFDRGDYHTALSLSKQLKDEVEALYGNNNTVYASSLSNIALMVS
jgi:hypothetical protein